MAFEENDFVAPVTNETGLGIYPNGAYTEKSNKTELLNYSQYAVYLIGNEADGIGENVLSMKSSTNTTANTVSCKVSNKDYYMATPIRCIME